MHLNNSLGLMWTPFTQKEGGRNKRCFIVLQGVLSARQPVWLTHNCVYPLQRAAPCPDHQRCSPVLQLWATGCWIWSCYGAHQGGERGAAAQEEVLQAGGRAKLLHLRAEAPLSWDAPSGFLAFPGKQPAPCSVPPIPWQGLWKCCSLLALFRFFR